MKKTIKIDGRDVTFDSSFYFAIIYKNQYNRDIMSVLMPVISDILKGSDELFNSARGTGEITPSMIGDALESIYSLEMTDIMGLIWAMAKMADENIPEPDEWFRSFEEFPIVDILDELKSIIIPSLVSKKKLNQIKKKLGLTVKKETSSTQTLSPSEESEEA